jgi:hypothetical protein
MNQPLISSHEHFHLLLKHHSRDSCDIAFNHTSIVVTNASINECKPKVALDLPNSMFRIQWHTLVSKTLGCVHSHKRYWKKIKIYK